MRRLTTPVSFFTIYPIYLRCLGLRQIASPDRTTGTPPIPSQVAFPLDLEVARPDTAMHFSPRLDKLSSLMGISTVSEQDLWQPRVRLQSPRKRALTESAVQKFPSIKKLENLHKTLDKLFFSLFSEVYVGRVIKYFTFIKIIVLGSAC